MTLNNNNEELNNSNDDLSKIDEEIINEKSKSDKEEFSSSNDDNNTNNTIQRSVVVQSTSEIQTKYKKVFNIVEQLNSLSKDVMNETKKFEQIQNSSDNNENDTKNEEKLKNTSSFSSNKGLAMLLNPLLNNSTSSNNDKSTPSESSATKIMELSSSMNRILCNLMDVLNEEKQKEIKQSEENNLNTSNNNVRCPIVITTGPPEKPNKGGFNRRNSSVTSPKFNRTSSVERTISVGNDVLNNESMKKINAILNSNGNTAINSPGFPSILSSIPFKKENKLFHRTRTWDPQYLNHYRSLSVQSPSSLRNVKSPNVTSSVVTAVSSSSSSNDTNNISSSTSSATSPTTTSVSATTKSTTSDIQIKPAINEEELKFQTFVQGLERKKTHLPSFYL